jgi:uncharacterized delta-60 repeat protein
MERTNVLSVGITMVILSLMFIAPPCYAQVAPGDLDPSFGTGGRVITDFGGYEKAYAVAVDSSGKIVVAGYTEASGGYAQFALVRYNSDGSLDPTFGTAGKVTTDFGEGMGLVYALVIDSQDRIVVAGDFRNDFALARYDSHGNLDTTFGSNGKVTTEFVEYGTEAARAIAIDSNGRIVVAGYTDNHSYHYDFALARYNSEGSLDTTFGTNGKVITDFGSTSDLAYALVIDSQGRIVVAGQCVLSNSRLGFALARYDTEGIIDTSFGTDGKVTTDFGIAAEAFALTIDGQGQIVAAGWSGPQDLYDFALARYNPNGSLDTTFGTDGKVTTDFNGGADVGNAVAVDSSGRILVAGTASWDDFALARYNPNGSLDTSFGTGGKVTTDFSGEFGDVAYAVAIDSGEKIILAGTVFWENAFGLARYLAGEPNPPTGSITINGGAEATRSREVTLALTASDDTPGAIRMCISNTDTCGTWTAFAATRNWTLTSGNGTRTVNVWFKDVWGNVNDPPYSDIIILDTIAPTNGTVTVAPGNAQVALDWTGFTDTGSGVGSYKVVFAVGTAPLSCSEGKLIYSGTDTSYLHTDLTNGTKYGYRVCAVDKAGKISTGATASAKPILEMNPPTGSITIKGGAEATKTRNVTLTLMATDETLGPIRTCVSNTATCTNWTAFAATKSWTLSTGNGIKTVNVWFRDVWGNRNDTPYSDTIILDTIAPTNGTVTATPGNAQVTLDWTGFTDTGSGVGSYKVVFSKVSAPMSCAEGRQIYKGPDMTYTHTGLTSGTTYYYRVCAIDEAGNTSTGKIAKARPQ